MARARTTARRRVARTTAVVGALLLLGACSSGPAEDSAEDPEPPASDAPAPTPTPTPTPTYGSENERLLAEYGPAPLDAMFESPEERDITFEAREILVEQCMSDLGFPPEPALGVEFPEEEVPLAPWDDGLGLVDPETASTYGYRGHMDAQWWAEYRAYNDAVDARRAQVATPERDEAEYGVDGCDRQASDALKRVDTSALDGELIFSLEDMAFQRTAADPAVVEATAGWTACMAESGYTVTAIPIPEGHPDPASPEEIAQAVADVACKQRVGLVDIYITALYASQQALIDEHRDQFDLMSAATDARVEAAREVVGQ